MTESSGKRGSSLEKLISEAEAFRGSSDQYAEFIVELGDALAASELPQPTVDPMCIECGLDVPDGVLHIDVGDSECVIEDNRSNTQSVIDEDERIYAWEQVAKHPVLKRCYSEERPIIDSVIDRLTSLFELEQAVNELAPAPQIEIDEAALAGVIRPLIFQYNQERITLKTFARAVAAWLKGGAR